MIAHNAPATRPPKWWWPARREAKSKAVVTPSPEWPDPSLRLPDDAELARLYLDVQQ